MKIPAFLPDIHGSTMTIYQRLDKVYDLTRMAFLSSFENRRKINSIIYIERWRIYALCFTDILGLPNESDEFTDIDGRISYNSTWVEYNISDDNFMVTFINDYAMDSGILSKSIGVIIDMIMYYNDNLTIWNYKIDRLNDNALNTKASHTPIINHFEEITPDFISCIIDKWDGDYPESPKSVSIKRLNFLRSELRKQTIANIIR